MKVIGYDKYVGADELRARGVDPMPDLASVLRAADVVTCHTPHTKETHHMIDAAAVAQMKPGVIFINTSRGKTQDESALLAGLESGKIRAAGSTSSRRSRCPRTTASSSWTRSSCRRISPG
jgi:D-3-phosphoglycerate dehydrogenase